jgi:hypothetical protein
MFVFASSGIVTPDERIMDDTSPPHKFPGHSRRFFPVFTALAQPAFLWLKASTAFYL